MWYNKIIEGVRMKIGEDRASSISKETTSDDSLSHETPEIRKITDKNSMLPHKTPLFGEGLVEIGLANLYYGKHKIG
jgi:hypothetical protein